MKIYSKIMPFLLGLLSLMACEPKESTGTLSAVAQITAFSFTANDNYPGLGEAVFVVEQYGDTGLIRMRENDSIRYGTSLDSVVPSISYYTTPSSVTFYLGDSAVALTGYDTLNLNKKPILIRVVAQNTDYEKWYKLNFEVHTMDGDLFKWDTVSTSINGACTHGTQKALMRRNRFYYYQNDGFGVKLFTSDDTGEHWIPQTELSGLPSNCDVRQIIEGDLNFFYGKGHDFYYSADGIKWDLLTTELNIVALYMCMKVNNILDPGDSIRLWMAAQDNVGLRFYTASSKNLTPQVATGLGLSGDTLPISFPIEEYTTIPFQSSSLHEHALIAGGYDRNHKMTAARWNLEYNYISNTYHMTNLGKDNSTLAPFAGSSASYYGEYIYLFGGIREDRSFLNNTFSSVDEGTHWVEVSDSVNSKRPKDLKGRYHTNTFVHDLNLYIIGGEDNSTTYSDVYRGRMNSIAWPEIGN